MVLSSNILIFKIIQCEVNLINKKIPLQQREIKCLVEI